MAVSGCRQPQRRGRAAAKGLLLVLASACAYWGTAGWQQPPLAFGAAAPESGHIEDFVTEHAALLALVVAGACAYAAKEVPPSSAAEAKPLDKRTDFPRVCFWSGMLALVSGMVNVIAINEMGGTVSHHTGNTSHVGRLLGIDAGRFAALMVAFTIGAGVAGWHKSDGDAVFSGRYSAGLMSSAVAVAAGTMIQWASGRSLITLPLWAFSQGIHNGVTSRFSALPLRTTHHTGTLTDLGLGFGAWIRAYEAGETLPSVRKPVLMCVLVLSFSVGGYGAKLLRDIWGVSAALVPAVMLAAMALPRQQDAGVAKA